MLSDEEATTLGVALGQAVIDNIERIVKEHDVEHGIVVAAMWGVVIDVHIRSGVSREAFGTDSLSLYDEVTAELVARGEI